MMLTSDGLKSCPFCGRIPTLKAYKGQARINCRCGASMHCFDGEDTEQSAYFVTIAWNRRSGYKVLWRRVKAKLKQLLSFIRGW